MSGERAEGAVPGWESSDVVDLSQDDLTDCGSRIHMVGYRPIELLVVALCQHFRLPNLPLCCVCFAESSCAFLSVLVNMTLSSIFNTSGPRGHIIDRNQLVE